MNEQINSLGLLSIFVSQPVNYTKPYFADHSEQFSHDRINRWMRTAMLTPRELCDMVRQELVLSENGYILFDDTILDKSHSFAIELVRCQWSGNAKKVIKGIGLVTCVYVNPDRGHCFEQAVVNFGKN